MIGSGGDPAWQFPFEFPRTVTQDVEYAAFGHVTRRLPARHTRATIGGLIRCGDVVTLTGQRWGVE